MQEQKYINHIYIKIAGEELNVKAVLTLKCIPLGIQPKNIKLRVTPRNMTLKVIHINLYL